MAKIIIAGNVAVVKSERTLEDIKTLERYRPEALKLYEGEGEKKQQVFAIRTAPSGCINTIGACFADASYDEAKKATITMNIPAGTEDAKKWVTDMVGVGIIRLNKVESQFDAALADIKAEIAKVGESIETA